MIQEDDDVQYDDGGYPPEEEPRRGGRRRLLALGTAGVAVAAFAGVVIYSYGRGGLSGSDGPPPLIQADQSPVKARPEQPGGLEVPHQDKLVYDRLNAGGGASSTVERLLPPPEMPLPRPAAPAPGAPPQQAALQQQLAAPNGAPPAGMAGQMPPGMAAQMPPQMPPQAGMAAQPPAAAPPAGMSGMAGMVGMPATKPAAPRPPAPAAQPAAPPPAAPQGQGTAPASGTLQLPSRLQPGQGPAQPPPAQVAQAQQAPAVPPAAAGGGGFRVQLASVKSDAEAQAEWRRLQGRFRDSLGGLSLTVKRADLGDKGIYYRVQGGSISEARAKEICNQLKSQNVGCQVVKP